MGEGEDYPVICRSGEAHAGERLVEWLDLHRCAPRPAVVGGDAGQDMSCGVVIGAVEMRPGERKSIRSLMGVILAHSICSVCYGY